MLSNYNQTTEANHARKDFTRMQLHGQIHYWEAEVKLWLESKGRAPCVCTSLWSQQRKGVFKVKEYVLLYYDVNIYRLGSINF
jgi:hypothetical protein